MIPLFLTLSLSTLLGLVPTSSTDTPLLDARGVPIEPREGRVVSIGAGVTEAVFALGAGERVVGRDMLSVSPRGALAAADVGYPRALGAEGILSLAPDLVLVDHEAGPPNTLDQLRRAQVPLVVLPQAETIDDIAHRLRCVGAAIGRREAADAMAERLLETAEAVRAAVGAVDRRPGVLFLYSRGASSLHSAGRESPAIRLIEAAGGRALVDVGSAELPLSPEAVIAAAPDVLVVLSESVADAGGVDALLRRPMLATTPAAREGRVVVMPYRELLGQGPSTGGALVDLCVAFHPELGAELARDAKGRVSGASVGR